MNRILTVAMLLSLALPLAAQERQTKPPAKAAKAATATAAATAATAATAASPTPNTTASAPAGSAAAADRTDLDRTAIVGNRELPKVLYIVPWKKPLPATLSGRPVASVIDEALAPVDRDVFRRHIAYDAQLSQKPITATPAPEPKP